jgi:peptidoglycan/LPS O-acetylase OafA/YrhL
MKILLNVFLGVLILLAVANLLFWIMAIGSGHNIPTRTTNSILLLFILLGVLIALVVYLKRRISKRNKSVE